MASSQYSSHRPRQRDRVSAMGALPDNQLRIRLTTHILSQAGYLYGHYTGSDAPDHDATPADPSGQKISLCERQ